MGIAAAVLRKFHGGVHPREFKELSEQCAIEPMPMPKRLYVPLHQHIGKPCDLSVAPGSKVLKGERIGAPDGFISSPVHAPTSGTLLAIEEHTVGHPSGLTMACAVIEPDGMDEWSPNLRGLDNPYTADPAAIRLKVQEAGVVGLGGATFPSHVKLSPPQGKKAELLILNGVECEPYLTCDARLMEERGQLVVDGARIMLQALQVKECVIGIENNKPAAIETMTKLVAGLQGVRVAALPVRYPQGAEKQLIEAITGRQVPSGGLPIDAGVIVHNVATAAAVRDAVVHGRPLLTRIVTVTGLGVRRPANVEALLGTPVSALLDHCGGFQGHVKKVVMGGPMMGVALANLEVPVVKGTSGLLVMTAEETVERLERPCIRCGNCVRACPVSLLPTEMAWFARADQFDKVKELNLFDCIECGSCSYVCPSAIPLIHYFRYSKLSLLSMDREKRQGELTKARIKAKEARVEQEKLEKERKKAEMKSASAARKPAAAPADKPVATSEAATSEAPTPAVTESTAATESAPPAETAAPDAAAARAARVAAAASAAKAARAAKAAAAANPVEGTAPTAETAPPEAPTSEAPTPVAPTPVAATPEAAPAEAPAPEAAPPAGESAEAAEKAARVAKAAAAARAAKAAREAKAAAAAASGDSPSE